MEEQEVGAAGCPVAGASVAGAGRRRGAGDPRALDGEALRYAEHTDFMGFTLLWQDQNVAGARQQTGSADLLRPPAGGLQVRLPATGEWVDCRPLPGALTVNAGDVIQLWTNDVFQSCTHRVVNSPPGEESDRLSLVYFTKPSNDLVVECLPTCQTADRPPRYAPRSIKTHIKLKIGSSMRLPGAKEAKL